MEFKIILPTDPLSTNASNKKVVIAESAAYNSLLQEMLRYSTGQISGRSILISGHRGSGKTTLVHGVIYRVIQILKEQKLDEYRVLPIEIHGPSLFKILPKKDDKNAKKTDQNEKIDDNSKDQDDSTVHALEQLTIAIYKAYSKEIIKK